MTNLIDALLAEVPDEEQREYHFGLAQEHFQNRKHCLCCERCLKFVGSVESQIASQLRPDLFPRCPQARAALLSRALAESGEDRTGYESDDHAAEEVEFDDDIMRAVGEGRVRLPYSELFPLDARVPCPGGCHDVAYCSQACAQADWASHHRLLCTRGTVNPRQAEDDEDARGASSAGPSSSSPGASLDALSLAASVSLFTPLDPTALLPFYRHAFASNDTFVLAAKVLAQCLLGSEALLARNPALDPSDCILRAALPYRVAHRELWWDLVGRRAESAEPSPVETAASPLEQARELAEEAVRLLRDAWLARGRGGEASGHWSDRERALWRLASESLLEPRWFASVMGIFELNNLSFEIENPVEDYFLHIDALEDRKERRQVMKVTQPLLDALGRRYCIYAEGTAFYPLQSCCNHSCAPSAETLRRETDRDVTASVYALEALSPGQEVTISYIDLAESVVDRKGRETQRARTRLERQEDLLDYGFLCRCNRCEMEKGGDP